MAEGPPEPATKEQVSNHRKWLLLRAMVISIVGKSGHDPGEVRTRETNENEPSIKRRKGIQRDIETNGYPYYWEKSAGYLGSEQMVSGVEVA